MNPVRRFIGSGGALSIARKPKISNSSWLRLVGSQPCNQRSKVMKTLLVLTVAALMTACATARSFVHDGEPRQFRVLSVGPLPHPYPCIRPLSLLDFVPSRGRYTCDPHFYRPVADLEDFPFTVFQCRLPFSGAAADWEGWRLPTQAEWQSLAERHDEILSIERIVVAFESEEFAAGQPVGGYPRDPFTCVDVMHPEPGWAACVINSDEPIQLLVVRVR